MIINSEVITSRNNPIVKWACTLQDKKGREREEAFLAEGIKLTIEAIDANLTLTHIFLSQSRKDVYISEILAREGRENTKALKVTVLEDSVFEKISTEKAPQGIISVIKYLDFFSYMDIINKEDFYFASNERTIILSSIRDPSNLGSVIRSAVAFGTERIILSDDCADVYNPKTVRSAMGSLFRVKVTRVRSLDKLIIALRESNRRVFAAELADKAISLSTLNVHPGDCFVIGNEGHGISSEISSLCDNSVYIPISNKTESLNASVAAAIFMWEQSK